MRRTLVKPGIATFAGTPRFFAAHGTTGFGGDGGERHDGRTIRSIEYGAQDRRHSHRFGLYSAVGDLPCSRWSGWCRSFLRAPEYVVSYNLITEGRATIQLPGPESLAVAAGDIVMVPHGDSRTFTNGEPTGLIDSSGTAPSGKDGSIWHATDLSVQRFDVRCQNVTGPSLRHRILPSLTQLCHRVGTRSRVTRQPASSQPDVAFVRHFKEDWWRGSPRRPRPRSLLLVQNTFRTELNS
jgi:hypothetical protein